MDGVDELPAFLHRRHFELATIFLTAHLKLPAIHRVKANRLLKHESGTTISFQDRQLTTASLDGKISSMPSFFGLFCTEICYDIKLTLYKKTATIESSYHFKCRNRFSALCFEILMLKTLEKMIDRYQLNADLPSDGGRMHPGLEFH